MNCRSKQGTFFSREAGRNRNSSIDSFRGQESFDNRWRFEHDSQQSIYLTDKDSMATDYYYRRFGTNLRNFCNRYAFEKGSI